MSWRNASNFEKVAEDKGMTLTRARSAFRRSKTWARDVLIMIIDWDDTLFPSSQFMHLVAPFFEQAANAIPPPAIGHGLLALPLQERRKLLALQDNICKWLKRAENVAMARSQQLHVYIVSNSTNPWVTRCCYWFYPTLYREWFENERLFVIHAADISRHLTEDTVQWKVVVMDKILSGYFVRWKGNPLLNHERLFVVSIGDGDDEHVALPLVLKKPMNLLHQYRLQVFMIILDLQPSPQRLHVQLQWLQNNIESLMRYPHNSLVFLRPPNEISHYNLRSRNALQRGLPKIIPLPHLFDSSC
jgi:hypothetical protein